MKHLFMLGLAILMAGCATKREVSLSEILQQIDVEDVQSSNNALADDPDKPSTPMADLQSSPVAGSTSADQATIQPDSILRVSVAEDSGLNGAYPVNDLGAISLGYVGPVILFNMTEREAKQKIQDILLKRNKFNSATVELKIHRSSYDQCRVIGLVGRPGVIKLGAGDFVTLNNALVRAGGVKGSADRVRVRVVREGMKSPLLNSLPGEVYSFVDGDGRIRVPHVTLRNNDVAIVYSYAPPRKKNNRVVSKGAGRWVLVLGEVNQEGFYRFTGEERFSMMNLYFKMGGLPQFANDKAVEVIRRDDEGFEERFKVNVKEILSEGDPEKDFVLSPGDRIIVKEKRISLF